MVYRLSHRLGILSSVFHRRIPVRTIVKMAGLHKNYTHEELSQFAEIIKQRISVKPTIGIICGSGLGGLAGKVENSTVIKYTDISGFPVSTVPGHTGQFVIGQLSGKVVMCMQGRFHMYEGYHAQTVAMPVRVMSLLGVSTLIVTNAAGGLNQTFKVGDVMLIKDHINFPGFGGMSPLTGPNEDRFGTRFPAMSAAYDKTLRQMAKEVGAELGLTDIMKEGCYCQLGGPTYETIAECVLLNRLGVDAVGMSTVPEVTLAVHCGMKVLGLSLITNEAVMDYDTEEKANHAEVIQIANMRAEAVQGLVAKLLLRL